MKNPIAHLIAIAFISLALAGCKSPSSQFYTLNSTAKGDGASEAQLSVVVGPVTIPAEVNRPQFTVQIAPNQVAVDEFNRWAEPLKDGIARVVAYDLSALLGTPRVAVAPMASLDPAYRVTIDVQRFDSMPGKSAQIEAVWVVQKRGSSVALSGRTIASEPVSGDGFDALAAAHSRALAKVSADIAAAIRTEAGAK